MTRPYYADDLVAIYHGDCRDIGQWLTADVLITDPPYGRGWRQGGLHVGHTDRHDGIAGDEDSAIRDAALALWGSRPAVVFGDLMLPPPRATKQVLVYRKAPNAGARGATGGWRRDIEAVYLVGPWPTGLGGRTSVLSTAVRSQGNPSSPQGKYDHPHAKPVDVMAELIARTTGVVADPFMGSGTTLVAAKSLGRRAIGVEIEEAHCEMAARRCSQEALRWAE